MSVSRPWLPWPASILISRGGGLGLAAITYVGVDYLRHISPYWHNRLQPVLWSVLAFIAIVRIPFYKHWSAEFKSALIFIASLVFMLCTLLFEMISVRSVTAVLGLDWHRKTPPLPDTGQWLLLALNEKLPQTIVNILRARIIGLHHFLMLFVMLGFSVLFNSIEAPGLGIGARYMFTMAIGRFLRVLSFVSTILPSPRPWCANSRYYDVPHYPHLWAQKFYIPYSSDHGSISQVIVQDSAYVNITEYSDRNLPDWGTMNFLLDFLRPTMSEGSSSSWYHLLKFAAGGCNDLMYSGHMLVAVLTAMAWTEAYGGFSSAIIWTLVFHSAQREIRERYHYTVDCVVAIYVGILLWKMTGFIWPLKDSAEKRKLNKLAKIQKKLIQAAKDSDIEQVQRLLQEVELVSDKQEGQKWEGKSRNLFAGIVTISAIAIAVLFFIFLSDG